MMVARHEMPGKGADTIRPVGNGMMWDPKLVHRKNDTKSSKPSHRSLRDGLWLRRVPGISCQATIILSLRDNTASRIPNSASEPHKLLFPPLSEDGNGDWELESSHRSH